MPATRFARVGVALAVPAFALMVIWRARFG